MQLTIIRDLDAGDIFDFGGDRYIMEDNDIYNARRFGSGGKALFSQDTPVKKVEFSSVGVSE